MAFDEGCELIKNWKEKLDNEISSELKEFKEVTKERLNKLESWIIAIVGLTFTTLVTTVVGLLMKLV